MFDKPTPSITISGAEAAVLAESDRMRLSCGSDGCESNCCTASAPIVLNPYEISLICRDSAMSYEDLLDIVDTDRVHGFPLIMLPRNPACRFWKGNGCSIYAARPLACRLFPLGRVFDGMQSQFVLPEMNSCAGLERIASGTVADYLKTQDAARQIDMADRWIEFVNAMERLPLPDKPVTSVAFHMLVYSPDTPPSVPTNSACTMTSLEDRFILRLKTALEHLPRFLGLI